MSVGSDGTSGFQSTLYRGAADALAAAITTKIGNVISVSGPTISGDSVEITNHDSSSGFREFLPGLSDGGEITAELHMVKATATATYALIQTALSFKIGIGLASVIGTWHCNGHITGFGTEVLAGADAVTNTLTIKVANQPTFTAAA